MKETINPSRFTGNPSALIELPHKVCEYACITVGIEDQYEQKTGVRLPDNVIKNLSMLGFTYIHQKLSPVPRMVFWSNNTGKPQHEFLGDVVGYSWKFKEGESFNTAFTSVINQVDNGQPVIIGLLDMYHLPYFEKFYHRIHIPEHYVLVVGYDLKKGGVYVTDNSRLELQTIPLQDLKEAWNVQTPGRGKRNSYTVLSFEQHPADLETILRKGFSKRARMMFQPPVGFMGLPGLRRFAKEFPNWQVELTPNELKASLQYLCMFSCSAVPLLPPRLMQRQGSPSYPYQAGRDRYSQMLQEYAVLFNEPSWNLAAESFRASGEQIEAFIGLVVDALTGNREALNEAAKTLPQIVALEEEGFGVLNHIEG